VGPYSALDANVTIERSEIEHSIVLEGSRISDLDSRMEASLIGRNVKLERTNSRPRAYRFMVGDNSEIRIH
jgi:glucose-1-phosphate thymidylyltransferase